MPKKPQDVVRKKIYKTHVTAVLYDKNTHNTMKWRFDIDGKIHESQVRRAIVRAGKLDTLRYSIVDIDKFEQTEIWYEMPTEEFIRIATPL